jgi:hypothetical protein
MISAPKYARLPLIVFAVLLIGAGPAGAFDGTGAAFEISRSGFDRIAGSVRCPLPAVEEVETAAGRFDRVRIDGTTTSREIGRPGLPVLRRTIQIPAGASPVLVLSDVVAERISARDLGVTNAVLPVQPPVPKVRGARERLEFALDEAAYSADRLYPAAPARIVDSGVIRGHAYATVEFYPVRYNPARGEFLVMTSADFVVMLPGADRISTDAALDRYASGPFERILADLLVNHDDFHGGASNPLFLAPPLGLLIIVPDEYEADILGYADWKRAQGYTTTIARLSETGPSKYNIRDYIQAAYETWEVPPTYVLLMGDTNLVPTHDGSAGNHVTDLKYGGVAGGDWLPEVIIGRFPFRTQAQLQTMVAKSQALETLSLPDTGFLNRTAFLATDDRWNWELAEDTHRYVILNYMWPNGIQFTGIRAHFGGDTQDVADAINSGRTVVAYSGHGWAYGWDGPRFEQADIRSLTNTDMYPFVTSHACQTGMFGQSECFGETWLREDGRGAAVFWGASDYTYWDEDDFLERRMYDMNFQRGFTTVGEMTYSALFAMNNAGFGLARYYFEAYNILGDPTLDVTMGHPVACDVTYAATVPTGPQDFTVEVLDGGEAVPNALVCVMKDAEVFEAGFTGPDGVATLSIDPLTAGAMGVTVTAHNMIPHEGSVTVE